MMSMGQAIAMVVSLVFLVAFVCTVITSKDYNEDTIIELDDQEAKEVQEQLNQLLENEEKDVNLDGEE